MDVNEFLEQPSVVELLDDEYLTKFTVGRLFDCIQNGGLDRVLSLLQEWQIHDHMNDTNIDMEMLSNLQDYLAEIQLNGIRRSEVVMQRIITIFEKYNINLNYVLRGLAVTSETDLYSNRWYEFKEDGTVCVKGKVTKVQSALEELEDEEKYPDLTEDEMYYIRQNVGQVIEEDLDRKDYANILVPSIATLKKLFVSKCLYHPAQLWAIIYMDGQVLYTNEDYAHDLEVVAGTTHKDFYYIKTGLDVEVARVEALKMGMVI